MSERTANLWSGDCERGPSAPAAQPPGAGNMSERSRQEREA
jgi:hypothetical protein